MKNQLSKGSLLCFTLWVFVCGSASADIINGCFSTGDFTGWTVSAYDEDGNPLDDLSRFIPQRAYPIFHLTRTDARNQPFNRDPAAAILRAMFSER